MEDWPLSCESIFILSNLQDYNRIYDRKLFQEDNSTKLKKPHRKNKRQKKN